MEVKDLADHDPPAFDLQQMEEISEAETGDIVRVNAALAAVRTISMRTMAT